MTRTSISMAAYKWAAVAIVCAATVLPANIRVLAATTAAASPAPTKASAPEPAASTGPSAPAPSGPSPAIESTLLEYQGEAEDAVWIARSIANAIRFAQSTPSRVIIATNADIATMMQLRAVLGQAALITKRLQGLTKSIDGKTAFPCWTTVVGPKTKKPPPAAAKNNGLKRIEGLVTLPGLSLKSPADLQTLIQTIAGVSAVTESASPTAGSLADLSLIDLVAGNLPRGTAFVPSVYPPGLLNDDISESLLGKALAEMDDERTALYAAADERRLQPACQAAENKATADAIAAEVTAGSNLVDGFEVSLFGGSSTAAVGGAPAAPTGTLIQLLSADAMLRSVQKSPTTNYYLASVHALESGANTLTLANLFLGSRTYYSGGTAAAFSVFAADGRLICSGVGYGYRGFVQAKDVGSAALNNFAKPGVSPQTATTAAGDSGEVLPPVAHFGPACPSDAPPAP